MRGRLIKTRNVIPVIMLLAACASYGASAAINPVGSYEFTTLVEGQSVTGTMHIDGTPGNYQGRIITDLFPEISITDASVHSSIVNIKANMPDGELAIRLVMNGADFKGSWTLRDGSGEFNGKKTK